MKLNKNGWSMKEMILLSSILFAFLLVAVFNIMRFYSGLEKTDKIYSSEKNDKKSDHAYSKIENRILDAGLDYYNENFNSLEDIKLSTDKMIKLGLLSESDLYASSVDDSCTGYILFHDGEPSVYISCAKYETKGYKE